MTDYKELCTKAIEIIKQTGAFIFQQKSVFSSADIQAKGIHNYVTYVDKKAEQMLVENFQKILPAAGFITEEDTNTEQKDEYNWIIDPLDGTTNFIHSLPPFSISVALMQHSKIVLGIIYEINSQECFYAWQGGKAYLNGTEISVTKTSQISDSLIATGFPYHDYNRIEPFMNTLMYFMKNSHGLRRLGSAAVDLAYVACGRLEAFYEYGLNPWDVAAGAFIVEQAGGKVGDFAGGNNYIFGQEIIAANSAVFHDFQKTINNLMNSR